MSIYHATEEEEWYRVRAGDSKKHSEKHRTRYLNEKKYDVEIMEHQDFRDLREVLKRKLKELKELGLGKSCSGRQKKRIGCLKVLHAARQNRRWIPCLSCSFFVYVVKCSFVY